MTQLAYKIVEGQIEELVLPGCDDQVAPGIKWGRLDVLFSPAFWATQIWQHEKDTTRESFKIGNSLKEEIAACLLGGYGIPSEVGNMAFKHLKESGCFSDKAVSKEFIFSKLSVPIQFDGHTIRYRFAKQKTSYLYDALKKCDNDTPPVTNPIKLRDWLLKVKGIGPKTASWIVRNWTASDDVAIIDIHIQRAGLLAGFFNKDHDVTKHYYHMEELYLDFAKAIGARASLLDAVIWKNMKILNQIAIKQLYPESSQKQKQLSLLNYTISNQASTHTNQLTF